MNGNVRTRSGLRRSFQWKELVRNHCDVLVVGLHGVCIVTITTRYNDVKPFSEVIKTKTALFNIDMCSAGVPFFSFRSTRFDNVKVLEELGANNILR